MKLYNIQIKASNNLSKLCKNSTLEYGMNKIQNLKNSQIAKDKKSKIKL